MVILILALFALALSYGCDKQKILQSTEYVEKTEYVELPPDTVRIIDTVAVERNTVDTVTVTDTVIQQTTVYDTLRIVDTVSTTSYEPNEHLAFGALQYYNNDLVIQFINQQFGLTDGWVFYLTLYQSDVSESSPGSYQIYGLIDYWTPDWAQYYPLEYNWQVTYTGGDPSSPQSWRIDEPATGVSSHRPGIELRTKSTGAVQRGG